MGEFESSSLIDTSLIRGSLYRTLKAIRKKGPLSKAEVARETGLSNPAAISAVDSLKEIGLIVEVGSRETALGRPPLLWSLNPSYGIVGAIDVDDKGDLLVEVADTSGCTLCRRHVPAHGDLPTPEALAKRIKNAFGKMSLALDDYQNKKFTSIVVALPGTIATEHGVIRSAIHLRWQEIPFRQILSDMGLENVKIERGTNLATLAEVRHNPEYQRGDTVLIWVGSGIGAGFYFDGKLFKGMGSIAGEIGHMIVDINGPPCLCGNRGCLECIVLEDLKSNDTIAAADHLLVGVINIVNAIAPDRVIIAGPVIDRFPQIVRHVHERLEGSQTIACREVVIRRSNLSGNPRVLGAIEVALDQTFYDALRKA